MFIMYVDESGDCGLQNSPSRYFVLSGIVIHELRWKDYLEQLINFRKRMLNAFDLHLRDEIHAGAFITRPKQLVRIKRNDRLSILRFFAKELSTMSDINIINVVVDKQGKPSTYDVFESAWEVLIQRFENTLSRRNFRGPQNPDERGMIIADNTDNKKLMQLIRKMRRFNPVPNRFGQLGGYRNLLLRNIIEDPNFRNSEESYFIQSADLVAYLLYQSISPNVYIRKNSGQNYFSLLQPVLCTVASSTNQYGIVKL